MLPSDMLDLDSDGNTTEPLPIDLRGYPRVADGIVDLGRPKSVQLAVLVDRGGRELPIQADYVGKYLQAAEDEIVEVRLTEEDQDERVILLKRPKPTQMPEEVSRGL